MEDEALLFYAGLLAQHPHSASALEGLLLGLFRDTSGSDPVCRTVAVSLRQTAPVSVCVTGVTFWVYAVAGSRVWDQQAKFRLQLGPLTYDEFCRFCRRRGLARLVGLTRFYVGQEWDFDVQLSSSRRLRCPPAVWEKRAHRRAAWLVHLAQVKGVLPRC